METKQRYLFPDGVSFEANMSELFEILEQNKSYLQNYQEMRGDLDDSTHVARGNGFCATQYSEEFIDNQISKYQSRIKRLMLWIVERMKTKQGLRSYIRNMKKRQDPAQLDAQSEKIMEMLERAPVFQQAQTVMMYSSLPDEVRTTEFVEKWRNRKRVILPTVVGDDIVPVELTPETPFAVGDFNILEPQNHPYTGGYDLIVVPGMAFDRMGNRLGRGKGYYDRFLSQYASVPKIGICFDFQLVETVPTEPNDIVMDVVLSLTDSRLMSGEKIW